MIRGQAAGSRPAGGLAGVIEGHWRDRFGPEAISALRDTLQALLTRVGGELPRYPMVLHRGGWPDGS